MAIRCPNCQHNNPDTARYCERCRVNLGDAAPKDSHGRPRYTGYGIYSRPARRPPSFGGWRFDLLADVRGKVLELGVRSGSNFRYYQPGVEVIATDVDAGAVRKARKAFSHFVQGIALGMADAQQLPFADQSFDAVVATLVFCSIPDPGRALDEIARVLRPGGRLYTVDHVRSEQPFWGGLMDTLAPAWKFASGGCNLNRRTEDTIRAAGYNILQRRSGWGGVLRLLISEPPEVAPSPSPTGEGSQYPDS